MGFWTAEILPRSTSEDGGLVFVVWFGSVRAVHEVSADASASGEVEVPLSSLALRVGVMLCVVIGYVESRPFREIFLSDTSVEPDREAENTAQSPSKDAVIMDCPSKRELLEYTVGKVDEERSEEIDRHLEDCPACTQALVETPEPSDTLVASLREVRQPEPYAREVKLQEVLAVVQAIGRDPSFVGADASTVSAAVQGGVASGSEDLGTIRDYQLLVELGHGGMGTVYKALHSKLKKIVALKVLPSARMKHAHAVERFELEMEAVGRLSHPNIVAAYDAGEHEGTHFLVMEHIDGVDLSELVNRLGPLPIADACELIRQAALGLQHAHEHSLVHRDIKPSNLMLTAGGQVKILDLGLARLHNGDRKELTSTGQLMGTVDYMAPEQTDDSHDVDIRADLYSLGATLFKLLCGAAPYADPRYNTVLKKLKAMATVPTPSIRDRRPDVPDELAVVVERLLAKEPEERFATPEAVAEALAPFADGADLSQLASRFVQGQDAVGETSTDQAVTTRSTDEHLSALLTETLSEEQVRSADVDGQVESSSDAQPQPQPTLGGWSRNRQFLAGLLSFAALFLGTMVIQIATDKGEIRITAYDPEIEVSVQRNGKPVDGFQVKQRPDGTSYYSGDYEIEIVGGSPDGVEIKNGTFKLTRDQEVLVEIVRVGPAVPDDNLVDADRAVPDVPPVASSQPAPQPSWPLGSAEDILPGLVARPAVLPGIKRWQVETRVPRGELCSVDWSPDGTLIACGTSIGHVRIYDAETIRLVSLLPAGTSIAQSVAWSPDGQLLAAGYKDGLVRLWGRDGTPGPIIHGYSNGIQSIAWSPDSKMLVASGREGSVQIWNADGTPGELLIDGGGYYEMEWSRNGQHIAAGNALGGVRVWRYDAANDTVVDGPLVAAESAAPVWDLAWCPDGDYLAFSIRYECSARIWALDGSGEQVVEIPGNDVVSIDWSPNGDWLAAGTSDGEMWLVRPDGKVGPILKAFPPTSVSKLLEDLSWSPGGETLVCIGKQNSLQFWHTSGTLIRTIRGQYGYGRDLDWDPEGNQLALGGADGAVRILKADGVSGAAMHGHEGQV